MWWSLYVLHVQGPTIYVFARIVAWIRRDAELARMAEAVRAERRTALREARDEGRRRRAASS